MWSALPHWVSSSILSQISCQDFWPAKGLKKMCNLALTLFVCSVSYPSSFTLLHPCPDPICTNFAALFCTLGKDYIWFFLYGSQQDAPYSGHTNDICAISLDFVFPFLRYLITILCCTFTFKIHSVPSLLNSFYKNFP